MYCRLHGVSKLVDCVFSAPYRVPASIRTFKLRSNGNPESISVAS